MIILNDPLARAFIEASKIHLLSFNFDIAEISKKIYENDLRIIKCRKIEKGLKSSFVGAKNDSDKRRR